MDFWRSGVVGGSEVDRHPEGAEFADELAAYAAWGNMCGDVAGFTRGAKLDEDRETIVEKQRDGCGSRETMCVRVEGPLEEGQTWTKNEEEVH